MSSNDPFPKSVMFTGAAEMAGKSGMEGRGGKVRVLTGREELDNGEEYELRPVKEEGTRAYIQGCILFRPPPPGGGRGGGNAGYC